MRNVFRIYWVHARKYWCLLTIVIVTMVAGIYCNAYRPYYLKDIINVFLADKPDIDLAKNIFRKFILLFVVINILYRSFDFCLAIFEARVMRDLDKRSFAAIQAQSVRFFENTFSGSLVKSATRFRNSFEGIADILLIELGRDLIMVITAFIIFLQTMPSFALGFALWVLVFVLISSLAVYLKYPLDIANAQSDTKAGGVLADSIGNHLTVKAFGNETNEQEDFEVVVDDSYQKRLRSWMWSNGAIAVQGILMAIGESGLIWWMIKSWEEHTVTAADFIFFQTYVVWLLAHLWSFGHALRKLFSHIADAQEMARIYDLPAEVKDAISAHPITIMEGRIDFHTVNFRYGEVGENILNDFNLHIPAGQSVGVVGKTGAGKSTVMKLLLRFYDVTSGSIRIDMQDIADISQCSLRQQIATVAQNPQLFHQTIRKNVTFGQPNASEKDILLAVEQAHAAEFVDNLPEGLDTIVGERGVKLSGGQVQRIAIARAILADPRILIFDEATSSLDSETEHLIRKAIHNLLRGRTSIVIAHRLSTIRQLDRIIVLHRGRIVEDGTHEELLSKNGHYANLWRHQSKDQVLS